MAKNLRGTSITDMILKKSVGLFNAVFGKLFGVVLCSTMVATERKPSPFIIKSYDYIRWATLELVGHKIYEKNVGGAVAEVGVYRGDFAKIINRVFPDRKLYLFDTFEGFNELDIKKEIDNGIFSKKHDYSKTNIDTVLKKMKYPQKCIIKKGYFPETATDLNETFAFVSLDTDIYEPIYNGLKYFYPHLQKGGYIFVHDYDSTYYPGVKKAVDKYCEETDIHFFQLPDNNGSIVITK